MIYQFREGSRFPVNPQVAGEALEAIWEGNSGVVSAPAVVAASRPDKAPLHRCFEWNNIKAAERYREEQARLLIRCVVTVSEDRESPETAIAYVHVKTEQHGSGYQPTAVVMADDVLRGQAVDDALKLLRGVQKRYSQLAELKAVFREIERASERRRQPKLRGPRVATPA